MIETVAGLTDLQIRFITAIGQLVIAAAIGSLTAYVAWRQSKTAEQQAKTARNKLRLDLFQQRLDAYESIEKIVTEALSISSGKNKELELIRPISEARWLFGPEVSDFIKKEIYDSLIDLWEARDTREQLKHARPPNSTEQAELDKAVTASNSLRKGIYKSMGEFRRRMDHFLLLGMV